jgi:phosphotransferase system enzyme I (PtsI)
MNIIRTPVSYPGSVISHGTVLGHICHFQSESIDSTSIYKLDPGQLDAELQRLDRAITRSRNDLKALAEQVAMDIGPEEAKIFQTHIMLLEDNNLIEKLFSKIRTELVNIEFAVKNTFEEFESLFSNMSDNYMKERVLDFSELKRRILSHLTGESGRFLCNHECSTDIDTPRIILTNELTPSMIALVKKKNIVGFITSNGGINSHAAILARAANIAYITGIDVLENIECGALAVIDSKLGSVIFHPDETITNKYKRIIAREKSYLEKIHQHHGPVAKTRKGREISIYANILTGEDINYSKKYKLAGMGLVRTEFLFLDRNTFPDIEEQIVIYSSIIDDANGTPVTFRLFDIGGDKRVPGLEFPLEENPLLGLRGIRYLFHHERIMHDQLTALAYASKRGPVKILYPLISTIEELSSAKELTLQTLSEVGTDGGNIPLGMMFEVPSVFVDPWPFIKQVQFACIGTNDLVQYLFGVDRNNSTVNHLYDSDNETVYSLLRNVITIGNNHAVDITLCGEINLETNFLARCIDLGIDRFSVAPAGAPRVIETIKKLKI